MKRERLLQSLRWIYTQLSRKTIKICKGTIIFIQEETEPNLVIDKADIFSPTHLIYGISAAVGDVVNGSQVNFLFFAWNFYVGYFSKGN